MMKIFCFMNTGKPLTEKMADILFTNAHDMVETQSRSQRIKGRDYDGIIETDFESVTFVGSSGFVFKADFWTKRGGQNKVSYFVRSSDLDGIEKAKWIGFDKDDNGWFGKGTPPERKKRPRRDEWN